MKFGYVGLGRAARLYHLPAVRRLPGAVVVVATPPDSHADVCIEALAGGTHVICEKPFAPTAAEADRVVAAALRAGLQIAVNHQFREMPIARAVHDGIAFCQVWQLIDVRADCERASLRASLGGRAFLQFGSKRAERSGLRLDFGLGGLAWVEEGTRRKVLARNPRDVTADATAALLGIVAPALREGREPPSSGREARNVIAVIEAAYESASTGTRVGLASRLVLPDLRT